MSGIFVISHYQWFLSRYYLIICLNAMIFIRALSIRPSVDHVCWTASSWTSQRWMSSLLEKCPSRETTSRLSDRFGEPVKPANQC